MAKLRLGVLISGRGSNLQALIDACSDPAYPAEIALVISNRVDAAGLARAAEAGIATRTIPHRDYPDRAAFDAALDAALREAEVELVCLAGFMRLLTADFVDGWQNRIVNIHPSLLPAFKGAHAHADVIAAGVRISGCTVHIVRPEMDDGPILVQAAVPVLPDDSEDTLAARVLEAEHRCYPFAVRAIAEGRVRVTDGKATVDADTDDAALLISPAPDPSIAGTFRRATLFPTDSAVYKGATGSRPIRPRRARRGYATMADEQQMLQRHRQIWSGFCSLLTWSLIGVVITLVLMWIFLI